MSLEEHSAKFIYTYMGTAFVLEPYCDGYRICGMDLASEDVWFPDSFAGKRIVPWVSLNQCSNPNIPWFHHFDIVRWLHIPDWMSSLDVHNFLFPNLEAIDIHPSPAHPKMTSIGPLLINDTELMRVFSAGYMESYTFPREIKYIGESAFAHTTITDINFENPFVEFHQNAFGGSRINQIIKNGEKQFITFGNLLYRCVYADSKKLTIPDHIRSFEKDAFKEIYIQRPDGSKDWTNLDFIEELESPVPIKSYQPFNGVKKYYVHSFSKAALENLWRIFPNMAWFEIMGLEHSPDYVTQQGVLFTKDMKTLVIYPKHKREEYTVPATVETIQSGAFKDNSYLKIVHLSESVRIIGSSAFERCNLEFIKLPKSVERIGSYAFFGTKIKEIHLPKSIIKIGIYALYGISSIHCYEGSTKGVFDAIKCPYSAVFENVDIHITRSNGESLRLFIPRGTSNSDLDLLESAWGDTSFDVCAYQKCYAKMGNAIDRYRFAFKDYQISGEKSVCAGYFKRISSKFSQILIDDKAEEELIELLQLGIIKAPALRKLLEYVQDKEMPTVSAYILQAISECEKPREKLRL